MVAHAGANVLIPAPACGVTIRGADDWARRPTVPGGCAGSSGPSVTLSQAGLRAWPYGGP